MTRVLDRGLALCLAESCADRFERFTHRVGRAGLERMEQGLIRFTTAGTLVILMLALLFLLLWYPFLKAG